jgi:hypothetical protein
VHVKQRTQAVGAGWLAQRENYREEEIETNLSDSSSNGTDQSDDVHEDLQLGMVAEEGSEGCGRAANGLAGERER